MPQHLQKSRLPLSRLHTRNKDQQILTMDSMQGTTAADVQNGTSYLSIMQSNLKALQTALN